MSDPEISLMSGVTENDLTAFKAWLEDPANGIDALVSGIRYEYNTPLLLYRTDLDKLQIAADMDRNLPEYMFRKQHGGCKYMTCTS